MDSQNGQAIKNMASNSPGGTWEMDAEEDRKLINSTLAGDKDSYGRLFEKYRQRIFGTVYRILHNEDHSLDIVQEAFIKAYQSLDGLRGESTFYPWLRTIACHLAIDRTRNLKRRNVVSLDVEEHGDLSDKLAISKSGELENSPAEKAEKTEFHTAVWKALDTLSEQHRAVFVLHAVENMTYKEISDTLDCPIGTVMSRLFYARKELQNQLQDYL
jgi:RNA polymerase sigma-70 factor, ECF subfamily